MTYKEILEAKMRNAQQQLNMYQHREVQDDKTKAAIHDLILEISVYRDALLQFNNTMTKIKNAYIKALKGIPALRKTSIETKREMIKITKAILDTLEIISK